MLNVRRYVVVGVLDKKDVGDDIFDLGIDLNKIFIKIMW